MKIFVLNVPLNHSCIDVLKRFGDTYCIQSWPPKDIALNNEPSMVFAKLDKLDEVARMSELCEQKGALLFAWVIGGALESLSNFSSPSLVDFIVDDFDEKELTIRLTRLVRLEHFRDEERLLSVPDEIVCELTKKQLILMHSLCEAGPKGLSKNELIQKIWKKDGGDNSAKANGFNVHMLYLRRRLEEFGFRISYHKKSCLYKLVRSKKRRTGLLRENTLQVINH